MPRPFGPYLLLRSIGEGGVGEVHLARPLEASEPRVLVIKTLHEHLSESAERMQRFRHEARMAVSVDSPHVVKVFDVGTVGEVPYIAMELVSGWALSEVLQIYAALGQAPPLPVAVRLARDGLLGLAALHEAVDPESGSPLAAVHRDVSPRNLMIHREGRLLLIDLGLGRSNVQDWRTRAGALLGTLGYMAPEQAASGRVDHRADLYSMSVIFYELLTLRRYISKGDAPAMIARMQAPVFVPPTIQRPSLPKSVDALLERALSLRPEDRYPSARELLAAVDALELVSEAELKGRLVLPDELIKRVLLREAEVESWLQKTADVPAGMEPMETTVFASRGITLEREDPTRASAIVLPVTFTRTESDGSEGLDLLPTEPGAPLEPHTALMTSELSGTMRRPAYDELREPSKPRPRLGLLALAVLATALGVGLAVLMQRSDHSPPTVVPVRVADDAPPRAAPRPAAEQRAQRAAPAVEPPLEPPPVPEIKEPKEPRPSPPPERNRVTPPKPRAEEPVPAAKPSLGARFRVVLEEAAKLKAQHPDRAAALDELITDASLWSQSSDPDKQLQALGTLEGRLARLR